MTPFEFKNLTGLSKPLTRLVEVIAEGIGGISRPILTMVNTEAKAHEIKKISEAIADSQESLGSVEYKDGYITIKSEDSDGSFPMFPNANFKQRISSRITYQEAKKQSNIEHITQCAAEELKTEEEVPTERPDPDWTARFFNIAEDITTENMQRLWGKILAGEIKEPGAYSFRALELLKNLTQKEAELFVKVAQIAFYTGEAAFLPMKYYVGNTIPDVTQYLKENFNLEFVDLLILKEIGLLVDNNLKFKFGKTEEEVREIIFTCGNTLIQIELPPSSPEQNLTVIAFTEVGKQLIKLTEKIQPNQDYIKNFASHFKCEGVIVKTAQIVKWLPNGQFHITPFTELDLK
jgi:uncharacterized repeat protein (TIGR03899 family)